VQCGAVFIQSTMKLTLKSDIAKLGLTLWQALGSSWEGVEGETLFSIPRLRIQPELTPTVE